MNRPNITTVGTGFLRPANGEAASGRYGAVELRDALGGPIPISNVPLATFATLIAVRLEIAWRKERRRPARRGKVITVRTAEVPVRLGAGRLWTTGRPDLGVAFGIGVEPDRPDHTGPWIDPGAIVACSGVQVRLEVHWRPDPPSVPGQTARGGRR